MLYTICWVVLSLVLLTVPARARAGPELTIVSYNIRYDNPGDGEDRWEQRRGEVAGVIRGLEADVVGIQEALRGQLDFLARELPGYGEFGVGRDDGKAKGEYAAILYRKERVSLVDGGTFWFSDAPAEPGSRSWGNRVVRICTWARFKDSGSGTYFYVFNVHLDHESQPSREKSAGLLAERIAARAHKDPVIVTGDFNAGEENAAVGRVKEAGFVDTFRVVKPDEKNAGTFNNFGRDGGAAGKIDYVFVEKGMRVTGAGIDRQKTGGGRYPSDHFAVWAKVGLGGP